MLTRDVSKLKEYNAEDMAAELVNKMEDATDGYYIIALKAADTRTVRAAIREACR